MANKETEVRDVNIEITIPTDSRFSVALGLESDEEWRELRSTIVRKVAESIKRHNNGVDSMIALKEVVDELCTNDTEIAIVAFVIGEMTTSLKNPIELLQLHFSAIREIDI